MPSYNTSQYIGDAVQSVLEQTYQNWELIIIDDCLIDGTDAVISTFYDDRIKFYKNDAHRGAAYSRNRAIKLAKGKYIAFLDSDDVWLKTKLEKQIKFMMDNDYAFTHTDYSQIDESSKLLGVRVTAPKYICKYGFYLYSWAGCLTVIYDAEKVGLIQVEHLKKRNDYAMWLKITRKQPCYLLKENLALYRQRKNSLSSGGVVTLIKHHYKLYRISEKMNPIFSVFFTAINLIFGTCKKIFYVKRL